MGYDIERFVGAVNEGLLCCICRDVLEEPLMAPCEHSYCSACVLGWLTHYNTCPEDRQSLWPSDLKPIFRYMKNDLDSLKIHCDHQSKGCKSVVRLGSLARHLKEECDFVAVACPNTGCNESLNRCDLDTHLIICDFQTAKCTRGCGLQVNMNELAQHNCINELRGSMEKQKSDFQTELRDMKRDMEDKLDAQRVEMVYKESTLQNQIEELKVQVSELVRETRLLKARETQRWSLSKAEQAEYRDIMEWLKGLKYQDDITEKYCGTCNKRFLHIRKEPLTSLREQMQTSHSCYNEENAFLTSLRSARQKPGSQCTNLASNYSSAQGLISLALSNESSMDRASIENWRRATDLASTSSPFSILSRDGPGRQSGTASSPK